jgi:hypothetical protein
LLVKPLLFEPMRESPANPFVSFSAHFECAMERGLQGTVVGDELGRVAITSAAVASSSVGLQRDADRAEP